LSPLVDADDEVALDDLVARDAQRLLRVELAQHLRVVAAAFLWTTTLQPRVGGLNGLTWSSQPCS
jgi:hypothetical protein